MHDKNNIHWKILETIRIFFLTNPQGFSPRTSHDGDLRPLRLVEKPSSETLKFVFCICVCLLISLRKMVSFFFCFFFLVSIDLYLFIVVFV